MIDLSFLTEEEAEAITKVLQRDAELKKAEEERVRHLPEKVKDDVQLKNMSGQWFYEAKSKRHRDKIHGADIIRASMRRKPASLAEMSQNKSSKNTWVSNFNKEVFVPPELPGIGEHQEEEQQPKSISSYKTTTSVLDKPEERHMKASIPTVKQRRNPFNSTSSGDNLNSGESENRPATVPQLSKKEILSLSQESHPKPNLQNDETEKHKKPSVESTDESQKGLVQRPVPKARKLIHKATNPVSQREDLVPKPAKWTERISVIGTRPGGILKRSSSSTDSEAHVSQMLDVQKKNGLPTATLFEGKAEKNSHTEATQDSTQTSREKLKQVRFSSSTGKGEPLESPQLHHSRETGEFDLLESDEIKNNGSDAIRSDSFGDKQISAVKPLGTYSSALQINTIDALQEDKSASSCCDTNRSVCLVNKTMQTKTVAPKKLETPQKTSSNILPNTNNELSVDETCGNKSNQILSHESNSHQNFTDEHQLSAKTDACEVSNTKSTSLQQGKPDLVEERDAKTTFKPDKHADELMEVADESVPQVLGWFKRSSGTEDRKHASARPQGREPTEKGDFSPRTAALPTEYSGPNVDGKTIVAKELPFGKMKQQTSNPPASFISEDTQMIKERMKSKKGEENEEQNDKSLTEFDCTRAEERECGQEIKQQRIKEIRAFWERDKTIPSHGGKEASLSTNVLGGGALKGLGESDRIKPTAVYLPNELDDQSKNMLRSAEISCASQPSRNEHQNSFEFGPGHAVLKIERTVPSGGEFYEYRELPKASNLQPRVGATSAFPESKGEDEKETLKGKVAACSQQKPRFQVLSLKEKMNEKSRNQISDSSHFQSLRNFWDTGVKLQNSIDRGDFSLPNNNSSINYERKAKEGKKGRDNMSKQQLIQQQMQTSEREKTQKLDSVVCELPLGSPTLKVLNVTHMKNADPVQMDRKPVISKPQEKMSLPEQAVEECIKKSIVSSKEHHVSLQLLQSPGDKGALKETAVGDLLCFPIEKVGNKTTPLDDNLPQEEVAETVDKVILPKAELDVFKLGLEKLEKEASETSSSLNLKENISKDTTFHLNQCRVFERTVEQSPDISPAYQKEEISTSTEKMNMLSPDEHKNKKGLRKLFTEFEPFSLRHKAVDKVGSQGSQRPQAGLQDLLREATASQPSEYKSVVMKTSDAMKSVSQTSCNIESTGQDDTDQPEEVSETTEKSVAPSKVSSLSSALKKLLEEASETPPPKPKCAESTVQRTAEMEVQSRTYEYDGELPQEIDETIEKSIVPSKVSGLSSALEKLLEEACETPPPKPKCAESKVQRIPEMKIQSRTYEYDGELPQEIDETIEKSVAPSKVSGLSSALEKLLEEASEMPPLKPKCAESKVQRIPEMKIQSRTYEYDGELPQEVDETIEKSVAPYKVSGLSSALEKLLEEASETPPPKPRCAESTVQRIPEMEVQSRTYEHDGDLLQEISETIERSVLPKAEYEVFDVNLQKLLKEVSETPASLLENTNRKMQGKIQTSQSIHAPCQQERSPPQEIEETIEKTSVSNIAKFSEFSSSLEQLLQEASKASSPISKELHKPEKLGNHMFPSQKKTLFMTMSQPYSALSSCDTQMKTAVKGGAPEQNTKASVNDPAVREIEASDLPKKSGAINKLEERNLSQVDLPPLEAENNMTAIKPSKINEKGRRNESTSLDASENNSESKALLKFSRASTPLKVESDSPQAEGAQLCLMSQHEDNNEEEGDSSNLGHKFSDENCSEEELNPVLMALKRSADRKMPSKSLEDIPSATSNKGKINNPKEELALSAEDGPKPDQNQERNENASGISTVPSQTDKLFSNPEKLRLCKSVPSFLQEESDDREADTASESSYSFARIKKSPSSLTNLSGSSGMASLSSVSGSLMSICSADFDNVEVKGSIQFAIDYVEQLKELHIFICQCKDLAVADVKRQRSDPYVKTYLHPEKYKLGKRKTSVKKKTFNPVYNEILRYKIEKDLLKKQSLNISVWHNDTFRRNSFLGQVELDLETWDWNDKSNKQIKWFPLKPRTSTMALTPENRGEMKLALQYVPHPAGGKKTLSTGEVHIWVKKCRDLPLLRGNRLNSFIHCTVLPDTSRDSCQKTRTVSKTTNPVFNHTMIYEGFRPKDLKEVCIELTVWDHNKFSNHFLGGLRIGLGTGKSYGITVDWMDSTSDETALWEKMMNSPNTWIEDTLPLRMLMVAKLTK